MREQSIESDFYVSTQGNDAWSGRLPASNAEGTDGPFATLARARNAVRELKASKKGAISVLVRGGTYYLDEALTFGREDSGSEDQAITYAAYPGEMPVISGGRKIVGEWKPYRDGIMMCDLPEAKEGNLDFTQLFVDGKRQSRARYPNYDPENPRVQGKGYINAKAALPDETVRERIAQRDLLSPPRMAPKGFIFDPETFTTKKWAKPQEAVVHIFNSAYWGNLQWEIEEIDWEKHIIWFGHGGFQICLPPRIAPVSRFFIENVFEELDAPGEWYLDKGEGILYYMPPEGVDLATADVVVPLVKDLVQFRGSQDRPVHHITLSGLRITHTTSTFLEPYDAPSRGDWNIHRGGAVFLEGAEHCAIERCFLDAVGGNAVFFNNYNRHNQVVSCRFTEIGESAVCLVGDRYRTYGSVMAFPADNLVFNNLIHDCGVFGKQVSGVFCANAKRTTISHNHIYNMPRTGICFNDCWGGGYIVEFNRIHHTVQETRDHGPFNAWGREWYWCAAQSHDPHWASYHPIGNVKRIAQETSIIRNNYFRGTEGYVPGDYRQAVDLDDGSSNFHVYNNLCVDMAIGCREGDYRTVENNIIVCPVVPTGFHCGFDGNHDRFRRNIIVTAGDTYYLNGAPITTPWLEEIDHNLFWAPQRTWNYRPVISARVVGEDVKKYTLAEWQGLGYDAHSVIGDPW